MKYNDSVMESLREQMGLALDDTSRDDEIEKMSLRDVISKYLEWNAIFGYTDDIINIIGVYLDVEDL